MCVTLDCTSCWSSIVFLRASGRPQTHLLLPCSNKDCHIIFSFITWIYVSYTNSRLHPISRKIAAFLVLGKHKSLPSWNDLINIYDRYILSWRIDMRYHLHIHFVMQERYGSHIFHLGNCFTITNSSWLGAYHEHDLFLLWGSQWLELWDFIHGHLHESTMRANCSDHEDTIPTKVWAVDGQGIFEALLWDHKDNKDDKQYYRGMAYYLEACTQSVHAFAIAVLRNFNKFSSTSIQEISHLVTLTAPAHRVATISQLWNIND